MMGMYRLVSGDMRTRTVRWGHLGSKFVRNLQHTKAHKGDEHTF